jgi:peptidoglycan hydrolase CwlO-like protein
MQRILLGLVAIAALAGWGMAFLGMNESSDLEDRLTATTAELSETSEQLTDTQSRLALTQGAASSLEDIDQRVAAKQAEAAALAEEMEANRRALATLRQDLDTGRNELGALTDRAAASKSALARLARDMEVATAKLGQLRAETERQRPAVVSSPAQTQTAVQAPKAPTAPVTAPATTAPATEEAATAAATPAVDPLADAKRRFARIDQDGDGRFDRLEFRLKRVSLFGLVDANEDDYLTLDETLLSPEAFQIFDPDGDGKISSREMADRQSFGVMDTDRDEFITFEEYMKFLRGSSE